MLGPEAGMLKDISVLNRVVTWTDDGITYEADQRHAEILVRQFGREEEKRGWTSLVSKTPGRKTLMATGDAISST